MHIANYKQKIRIISSTFKTTTFEWWQIEASKGEVECHMFCYYHKWNSKECWWEYPKFLPLSKWIARRFNVNESFFTASCPPSHVLNPVTNTCFRVVTQGMNWHQAKSHCESSGEKLAVLDTKAAFDWLRRYSQSQRKLFFLLNCKSLKTSCAVFYDFITIMK